MSHKFKDEAVNAGSYKVRKSGNSDITTIPNAVKKALSIDTGDQIEYIIDAKGIVKIRKKIEEKDLDPLIKESLTQYHDLLEELVEK